MPQLIFSYPSYFILFCVVAGILFGIGLYYKDKSLPEESKKPIRLSLAAIRALGITLILILLLSPFWKIPDTKEEKPIIIVLNDKSQSVNTNYSLVDSAAFKQNLNAFTANLKKEAEIHTYHFDSKVYDKDEEPASYGVSTNISKALEDISGKYVNRNVANLVLITDGIYNEGKNPIYSNYNLVAPISPLAIGDTVPKKDLKISNLRYNKVIYYEDKFLLKLDIEAINSANKSTTLTISEIQGLGKKEIYKSQLNFGTGNDYREEKEVIITPSQTGLVKYEVKLTPISGEITESNNQELVIVEIIKQKSKICILTEAPHPDLGALKQSIETNKNFQAEIKYIGRDKLIPNAYQLIIAYQLPSIKGILEKDFNIGPQGATPIIYIVGSQSNLDRFNRIQKAIKISSGFTKTTEVFADQNAAFSLFTPSQEFEKLLNKLPPIYAPFGRYSVQSAAGILYKQKVGNIKTEQPLFAVQNDNEKRVGYIIGEGIWRWRLYDYMINASTDAFDEMLSRFIQYLTVNIDKRKFAVRLKDPIINANEGLHIEAELFDEVYNLVNDPEVGIIIKNEEGDEYPYSFKRKENYYVLNPGSFADGNYTFIAQTKFNDKIYTHSGGFIVRPVQLESLVTTANHSNLRQLANQTGGNVFYNFNDLEKEFRQTGRMKTVLHTTEQIKSIISLKWILFLLVLLFGAEWFTRKYLGGI